MKLTSLTTLIFPLAALALIACGPPDPDALCERYAEECNAADELTDCKQALNQLQDLGEQQGCEDLVNDYLTCVDELEDICSVRVDACETEAAAAIACTGIN
ncbi:MAG: hypothetical protein U0271_25605 [Polyangiaceae bacterium]